MIRSIIEAAREKTNFGFIISLKKTFAVNKVVEDAALPNVLLRNFVPQIELLSDERLKAFISHGGGNSIAEAMYYGTPLIAVPLSKLDQFGAAFRM